MANNVIIFGDSYSTYEGYIPEGYDTYYCDSEESETDVRKVEETWWHQLVTETGMNLVLNNSWSGSTIGYTGYDNEDCSKSSSFIYRLETLTGKGFFRENRIDTVFVFGGTNDSWSEAPLGERKYENWEKEDLYSVLPAISYFFKTLKDTLPEADIYCLINTELKDEITDAMKEACQMYGVKAVAFENIDKECCHPTIKGMQDIKNFLLDVIR